MLRSVVQTQARLMKPVQKAAAARFLATQSSETYTEKQAKKGRPVSPHVTIYKFPVVALSSITNRVTGVILSGGLTGIGALALVGVDVPAFLSVLGDIPALGFGIKFGVAFPLVYHYLGGIRHMLWDRSPEMLENEKVEQSSMQLFAAASVISAGVAFI